MIVLLLVIVIQGTTIAQQITAAGQPALLEIRIAGEHSIRVTLKPVSFKQEFPFTPALAQKDYPTPIISLAEINHKIKQKVGNLYVEIRPDPLTIIVVNTQGKLVQELTFMENGNLEFKLENRPVLGMGEGGPRVGRDWRDLAIEFDRRGRLHQMQPRWQGNSYGSRNPVAMLIGTDGWGLFLATPWGEVDLTDEDRGLFIPWKPIGEETSQQNQKNQGLSQGKGRPPVDTIIPGMYDFFVFDAQNPAKFMNDLSKITGPAVLPPKWALGYMQSHRTLENDKQMIKVVDTFREKQIPIDAVIYLGTGFCPSGWNTEQPSFEFNPDVFKREPKEVISDLHQRNVKVIVHMVPWDRDKLPTLQGSIPPKPGETIDRSHILNYWQQHLGLVKNGIDAFWPDEGDWFNLFERINRHQLYYQGPLSTKPNIRPWSLHRNGHLGIAQWGGWVWSGDTESSWKTLEGQIAVGINHSLSLSPFWGSDIGGFYPNPEFTGELYARWFQFGAFCPSFRSHGKTWWTRLPWGWGLSEMGPLEHRNNPLESELNNMEIEPICKKYAELRYQLMPYTYTLAWQAFNSGMPLMRAMWLHYPQDEHAGTLGTQYMWGPDLLIAPVFRKGAKSRDVYLPEGEWYDYWTNIKHTGGQTVIRQVNLTTMPIYVKAGAIIPFDPIRQYTNQSVDEPTTIKVYRGADGSFTMYEDDGISLDYLQGKATWTRFTWEESEQKLKIDPDIPDGSVNPVIKRIFKILLLPDGITKTVDYSGQSLVVMF